MPIPDPLVADKSVAHRKAAAWIRGISALLRGGFGAAIVIVGAQYAYVVIFSHFGFYDDEGTMMLRVKLFIDDPSAYDNLAGIYGPFYFLFKWLAHALTGWPVTHDITRLTSLVFWIGTAVLCAFFTYAVSRIYGLAAIVLMQMILHLSAVANEPGHPQGVSIFLLATVLLCSLGVASRRTRPTALFAIGGATAALLLTKLNLGVYLGCATAVALLSLIPGGRWRRALLALTASAVLLLPAAVLSRHLRESWALDYALVVTLAIAAVLVLTFLGRRRSPEEPIAWRLLVLAGAGFLAVFAAVLLAVAGLGSPLTAILQTAFVRPLRLPSLFTIAVAIDPRAVLAGCASLALALCFAGARPQSARGAWTSALRLALQSIYGGTVLYWALAGQLPLLLSFATPFLWIVLLDTGTATAAAPARFPRLLLCLVAATQALQAYPISGSQLSWATFLMIPAGALCLGDAWRTIWVAGLATRRTRFAAQLALLRPILAVTALALAIGYYRDSSRLRFRQNVYKNGLVTLALPGARRIHLTRARVAQYQWLTAELQARCDGFIGMPSYPSLYFWTGIEAPGALNGAWVVRSGSRPDWEASIVEKMQSYARPCVVHNESGVAFWLRGGALESGPLVDYIRAAFEPSGLHNSGFLILTRHAHETNSP